MLVETSGSIHWACTIRNLHIKGGPAGGVLAASPMPKLVYFLRQGKRSIVDGFVIAYLSLLGLLGIYRG